MQTREQMLAELRARVVPVLRKRGFTGTFPHFRRARDRLEVLTFQFDRHGGGFVIEAGTTSVGGFTTAWGKFIPANQLRAWDLPTVDRRRLKPPGMVTEDFWYRYDGGETCAAVAELVLRVLPE